MLRVREQIEYATDVKSLLFLARLELLCKTGCVLHDLKFSVQRGHIRISSPKISYFKQIHNYQILNVCRVLYERYFKHP